ncbi:hypothetical protein IT402_03105 [Candidatus Nomurabacteria bacterium]|nr:hypothetical protein [Candidatus Nomurabacteria bacterium]
MVKKNKSDLEVLSGNKLSLQEMKDTDQGLLMRVAVAIMEHRYESIETVYLENKDKQVDSKILCFCVIGMMHIINSKPVTTKKFIIDTARKFKVHKQEILNSKEFKKLDGKKYFVYSFNVIIETFIGGSLENCLEKEIKEKKMSLLEMVNTGGMGRSYRFNLNTNLPDLMKCKNNMEDFFILLQDLPIDNQDERIIELAYSFFDEGKHHVLTEEKFFQPSAPSVSTTAIWHNYFFLRDSLFLFNSLLSLSVQNACMLRSLVWHHIQLYLTNKWIKEGKSWYLNDIRKKFPKEKLINTAVELDKILSSKPTTSLNEIVECIEKGIAKK